MTKCMGGDGEVAVGEADMGHELNQDSSLLIHTTTQSTAADIDMNYTPNEVDGEGPVVALEVGDTDIDTVHF